MEDIKSSSELNQFLLNLHPLLFPEPFQSLSKELLFESTMKLTRRINDLLKDYHELTEPNIKLRIKPILIFSQDLLAQMSRLLKFESEQLTKFNQILMDLKKFLTNQKTLLEDKYVKIAERDMKLMNDKNFIRTMEKAFHSFIIDSDKEP